MDSGTLDRLVVQRKMGELYRMLYLNTGMEKRSCTQLSEERLHIAQPYGQGYGNRPLGLISECCDSKMALTYFYSRWESY